MRHVAAEGQRVPRLQQEGFGTVPVAQRAFQDVDELMGRREEATDGVDLKRGEGLFLQIDAMGMASDAEVGFDEPLAGDSPISIHQEAHGPSAQLSLASAHFSKKSITHLAGFGS